MKKQPQTEMKYKIEYVDINFTASTKNVKWMETL